MQPSSSGKSRYELRQVLGKGGMGVIYVAWDQLMRREVALKTILDVDSPAALELFYREWALQASIAHPNIVEIYDIGEMELEGARRPYFVMPLLDGATLGDLIRAASPRLTLERTVSMIVQACRGLQAAHDRDLIHRDLKPSNLFVLNDDSVKILDFGIARTGSSAQTAVRGTLSYMAPELLQMKPAEVASDIFALGVVAYEALTGRRPFEGASDADLSRAILHENPPSVTELKPAVPMNVSRAIAKAMAKQSWHRYPTAREFGETLYRAFRGEALAMFDPAKVQPRVERANRAFEQGEYAIASEILSELESEGFVEQEITTLRRQVEQAQRRVAVRSFLEGARRFNEEEEFTLALRKVQEALDLDPRNTDAQALKADIERHRRSRKIEEWAQLARQHLDNNAFQHARQAIESLLELRPNEPHAVAMLTEIQRKEEEFERLKNEKDRLYASARDSFERGEVTTALANLDRWMDLDRQAPETQSESLLSLQNFYRQVRGEHEAIRAALERARQHLSDNQFDLALALCSQYLAKYPDHALFQALQFDIQERKRQGLSALIAETDRRVESEPDVDRRIAILEEALASYPEEPHFLRALSLTRDKRTLVDSVVSKARLHEDEGRFAEALDQWEMLTAIHPAYPGLEFEVDRLRKRREGQARQEAHARWVAEIDRLIEAREFERALSSARQALSEFPDDAELQELEAQVTQAATRAADARRLAGDAQQARSRGDHATAVALLEQAAALDSADPHLRTALVQALAEQARELSQQDPDAAAPVVEHLLELDPSHTLGMNLRAIREDQEREEFVSWCTSQARKLQSAGDIEGALAIIRQGLEKYPRETRIQQLTATLERSLDEKSRSVSRERDLAMLQRFIEKGDLVTQDKTAGRVRQTLDEISARHPGDGEIQAMVGQVRFFFAPQPKPAAPSPPAPPSPPQQAPPAPPAPPPPPPPAETLFTPPPDDVFSAPPSSPPDIPPPLPPPAAPSGAGRLLPVMLSQSPKLRYGLIAAAVMILLFGIVAIARKALGPSSAGDVVVEFRTNPPGAAVRIGGENKGVSNLSLSLAPGEYQAEFALDGYEPAATRFRVEAGNPLTVELALSPWKPVFRLYSEAEGGEVRFDGRPLTAGPNGESFIDGFQDGEYEIRYASRTGEAAATVRFSGANLPALAAPPTVKDLVLVLVHQRGDGLVVYTHPGGASASIDGGDPQPVPPEGRSFTQLTPGSHTLSIEDGKMVRSIPLMTGGGPAVSAFIFTPPAPGRGSLLLLAGVDGAEVLINGRRHWQLTRNGQVRVGSLGPGAYQIRVQRDGYEPSETRRIEIVEGEETRLELALKPVARMATLQLNGPTGAQVFIDGAAAGAIDASGSFTTPVSPGSHTIELRRGTARSRLITHNFTAGETYQPISTELALIQPDGSVRFDVLPANATLLLRRQGEPESQGRRVDTPTLTLPEGSYILVASAPGFNSAQVVFAVQPGGSVSVPIRLATLTVEAPKPKAAVLGMADFDEPNEWDLQAGWHVRRGGNYATFARTPTAGVFTFTIQLRRGKRLQWFLDHRDDRNHVLFRMDRNSFTRLIVINGRANELAKVDHGIPNAGTFEIRMTVTPTSVTHELRRGGQWVMLDDWRDPNADPTRGKFGFYIPGGKFLTGSDEYAVKDFQFTPGGR